MQPSVLVFTPLHPSYGIRPETLRSVQGLAWGGSMTVALERLDVPREGGYADILRKYQLARQMTLMLGYDALLTVEADIILPSFALERLIKVDADIAYGLYCTRMTGHQWLAASRLDEESAAWICRDEKRRKHAWGSVVRTVGVGLGCTLIRRHVLETVPFRLSAGGPANDWWFALDVQRAGFSQAHDCGTVCGHILHDGSVIWPDPETIYRKEAACQNTKR